MSVIRTKSGMTVTVAATVDELIDLLRISPHVLDLETRNGRVVITSDSIEAIIGPRKQELHEGTHVVEP